MSDNIVLKGGISNIRYIWRTNGSSSCELCEELDGNEYECADDIPDKPHPNCNCYLEEVVENDDDDDCYCCSEIEASIVELEEIIGDAESLNDEAQTDAGDVETMISKVENMISEMGETLEILSKEYGKHLPDCENNIDAIYDEIMIKKEELQNLLTDIFNFLSTIQSLLQVITIFVSNYIELLYHAYALHECGMDKYYHSVANCQCAQLGELETEMATGLSDLKELYDQYTYVQTHKVTLEEAIADSERDQVANRLSRERGRNNPTCDCHILMKDLLPKNKK